MKKIGFVDYYLSEWHANNYPEFIANICRDTGDEFCVAYAWAEEYVSPVDGRNTDEWCSDLGVERCATIDELCKKSDFIVILSPDNPEKHLEYAKEVLKHGKRTYIDKTFAPDYATAKAIFDEGRTHNAPFFSTSALRYAEELKTLDCSGGLVVIGGGSDIKDYAIHIVEIIVTLIKSRPLTLTSTVQGSQIISAICFEDGYKASFVYSPGAPFAVSCCNNAGEGQYTELTSDFFGHLMEDILKFFKDGILPFDSSETLTAMKLRDAIIKSCEQENEVITIR